MCGTPHSAFSTEPLPILIWFLMTSILFIFTFRHFGISPFLHFAIWVFEHAWGMAFYKSFPHTFGQDCSRWALVCDLYSVRNFQSDQIDRNIFTLLSVKCAASCDGSIFQQRHLFVFTGHDENVKVCNSGHIYHLIASSFVYNLCLTRSLLPFLSNIYRLFISNLAWFLANPDCLLFSSSAAFRLLFPTLLDFVSSSGLLCSRVLPLLFLDAVLFIFKQPKPAKQ